MQSTPKKRQRDGYLVKKENIRILRFQQNDMRTPICLFLLLLSISKKPYAAVEIRFHNKSQFASSTLLQKSINDAENLALLLDSKRDNASAIQIQLELIPALARGYRCEKKLNQWHIQGGDEKTLSDAIYGFLENILGFGFYHPRELFIPDDFEKKLDSISLFEAEPAFRHRAFHLHTMHPIELTEDLLDPTRPNALSNVKEYIDWLARNGQNYFEFNLLESIQLDLWINHARQITDYAHGRGIRCGIDLSLNMLQQKAFQLYEKPPFSFEKASKQLQRNVEILGECGFDLWNVELSATEFSSGNQKQKRALLQQLTDALKAKGIQLMSRNHVVKPDHMISAGEVKNTGSMLNPDQGLMVHTVMFYGLRDEKAPVYRNENLQHMLDILIEEKERRETWYFPESAYWVTFDNSVPMLLLPYFQARLDDILLCDSLEIPGHITFSSGWEWGYGLVDYSIAQWSWNKKINGVKEEKKPLQYVQKLIRDSYLKMALDTAYRLQVEKIKEGELIRVLVAQTVTDELPGDMSIEFHPRPEYTYAYLRNKAESSEWDFIRQKYEKNLLELAAQHIENRAYSKVEQELADGLNITYLRAKHKYYTLQYLYKQRNKEKHKEQALDSARHVRKQALEIVKLREQKYRYPLEDIALKNKNKTCYAFGYLYPVHELHFWEREEKQARRNRYDFLFKNIWSIGKTIGITD